MSNHYNNLRALRDKKNLLKKDVRDLENLITFENPKESLSVITHGFTDQYLRETETENGNMKLALDTQNIIKEVGSTIKDSINKNSVINFASSEAGASIAENALKIGLVTVAGNFARKNLASNNWKKKAIGLALIYVAPIALKYVREKLDQYQKNKATSSFEQLI